MNAWGVSTAHYDSQALDLLYLSPRLINFDEFPETESEIANDLEYSQWKIEIEIKFMEVRMIDC